MGNSKYRNDATRCEATGNWLYDAQSQLVAHEPRLHPTYSPNNHSPPTRSPTTHSPTTHSTAEYLLSEHPGRQSPASAPLSHSVTRPL